MLSRSLFFFIAPALLCACGPRLIQPQNDDASVPMADATPAKALPPAGECVVAERLGCCSTYVAATRQQVMEDACLRAPGVPNNDDESCVVDAFCARECTWERPPSRAVTMRDGRCVFVDECTADADCAVVEDCHACCCQDAIAKTIAAQDECLFLPDEEHNDCYLPCPGICPLWPGANWPDGTSYGFVARCETVASPDGEIKACVPRPPTWGYLLWQAPGGYAGQGPALEITRSGSTRLWREAAGLRPDATSGWDVVFRLPPEEVDALFTLLSKVSFEELPHKTSPAGECYPRFFYQRCAECVAVEIDYGQPGDLSPELDAVYAWLEANVAPKAEGIPMPGSWCTF